MRMSCLVLLLVSAAAFAGCTERELDHRAASGRVEIAPVWAGLNRPSAAGYRFYGADNKPAPVEGAVAEASVDSFSVVLPEGRYSCLAYNTDAQGVTFTGLDNRLLAEVRLSSEAQPGNVYSWSVEEVEVTSRGDVRYTPVPLRLVKQVVLRFRVTGVEGATVLNGTLNGVYPSLSCFRAILRSRASGRLPKQWRNIPPRWCRPGIRVLLPTPLPPISACSAFSIPKRRRGTEMKRPTTPA